MAVFTIKLIGRRELAFDTMAFIFEKPKNFTFKAGQTGDFTLINPKEVDDKGIMRTFTLANPPHAEHLMIATRMRDSAYKRTLKFLPIGATVTLEGPFGSFTLHNNIAIPAVYLTGGIGITPARSIVLHATTEKLAHRILLFYANRRPEDSAFLDELTSLTKINPHYQFIPTMTEIDKSNKPWNGEVGFINKNMLLRYIKALTKPIYYLCGPASMVAALRKMLNDIGIDDDNIRTEEFSGY